MNREDCFNGAKAKKRVENEIIEKIDEREKIRRKRRKQIQKKKKLEAQAREDNRKGRRGEIDNRDWRKPTK